MPYRPGIIRYRELVDEERDESFIVPCSPRIGQVWEPDYVCECGWEGDEPDETLDDDDNLITACPQCGYPIPKEK